MYVIPICVTCHLVTIIIRIDICVKVYIHRIVGSTPAYLVRTFNRRAEGTSWISKVPCKHPYTGANVSICDKRYHINAIWVNVRAYSVTCHIVSVITIIDIRIKEKIKRTPIRVSTSTLEDTLILQGRRYCTFYIASTPCYSSKSGGNVSIQASRFVLTER